MISNLPVSLVSTPSTPGLSGAPLALGSDVVRFQQAMSTPTELPEVATSQPEIAQTMSPIGKPSLGDSIISGLQSASQDMQAKWAYVSETLSGADLGVTDALRLQMSVMQASVQYELISKGISKTVQNLDQTLKTQ